MFIPQQGNYVSLCEYVQVQIKSLTQGDRKVQIPLQGDRLKGSLQMWELNHVPFHTRGAGKEEPEAKQSALILWIIPLQQQYLLLNHR